MLVYSAVVARRTLWAPSPFCSATQIMLLARWPTRPQQPMPCTGVGKTRFVLVRACSSFVVRTRGFRLQEIPANKFRFLRSRLRHEIGYTEYCEGQKDW